MLTTICDRDVLIDNCLFNRSVNTQPYERQAHMATSHHFTAYAYLHELDLCITNLLQHL